MPRKDVLMPNPTKSKKNVRLGAACLSTLTHRNLIETQKHLNSARLLDRQLERENIWRRQ